MSSDFVGNGLTAIFCLVIFYAPVFAGPRRTVPDEVKDTPAAPEAAKQSYFKTSVD